MATPQDTVLDLLYGRWRSQTLYAGVKLDIFEVVRDEPLDEEVQNMVAVAVPEVNAQWLSR